MQQGVMEITYFGVYGLAFGLSMLALLMTSMLMLRLLLALSSTSYAIYYYAFPAEPLWLDVSAEIILVSINCFMLAYLALSNSRIKFDQREQFLYENEFPELSRVEFRRLLRISEWHLEAAGHVYAVEGREMKDIFYLISGHAEAELPDGSVVTVPRGSVIGEVSFRLKCAASATVTSTEACVCLRWNQDELHALCDRYFNIKRAVDNVLSSHMARKLSDRTNGRGPEAAAALERG